MGFLDRFVGSPQDRFAREVVAELRRNGVPEVTYDPDEFAIHIRKAPDDGEAGDIYLHNVFHESAGLSRSERRERIRRLIAAVVRSPEPPQTWDGIRSRLRPVLRSAHFGLGAVPDLDPAKDLLSRKALPHLDEYVVIDMPTSMAYVTGQRLEQWGVSTDEVFAAARANLAAHSATPDDEPSDGPAILRFVDSGDGYFTSRLLVDGWLAGLAGRVGGRPVAFAPDRDTLIVVADEPELLPKLFELVEGEYLEAVRGLSPQAYTVAGDGTVGPYPAPDGHPLAALVRRADTHLVANEYAAQGEWLERTLDGDVFVAGQKVFGRPDGSLFTVASWAEGVETLLPRADYVAFTGQDMEPFFVAWDGVLTETDLVPEPGLRLPRYRVRGWPQAATVERLRTRATTP
jgi:hypothetical protein